MLNLTFCHRYDQFGQLNLDISVFCEAHFTAGQFTMLHQAPNWLVSLTAFGG